MDKRGLLDLMIARLPGIGARDKISLCETFAAEEDLINTEKGDIENILGHKLKLFWETGTIRAMAEQDTRAAYRRGLGWIAWKDAAYPPLLREIYDPPALLFFRGVLPNPEKPLAAVVGTRRPSPQAAAQAYDIGCDLGQEGISVVSGLALGTDAMAHRGNLEGGAPTYAVLGSGADEIYPKSNRALAQRILETGGALLSEYPPGTGPFKWNFPARNRIAAGMSRGVVIVEAPEKSGALITARLAADYGRDLWVASAGADTNSAMHDRRGSARLAENGVKIIFCARDILDEWNIEAREKRGDDSDAREIRGGKDLAVKLARSFNIEM